MNGTKVLLVTAASSDVGGSIIRKIAQNYDFVLAHYNSSLGVIEKLQEEFGKKIVPIQADFSNSDSVEKMISKIEELDLSPDHIVHLASQRYSVQRFSKESAETFESAYKISVLSIVKILQAFLPKLAKQKSGKVVFMLSDVVLNMPPKYQSCYSTTKYALLGLMKNLAVEYADKGICVNAVSPDMIETKFLKDLPRLLVEKNAESNPLGRNLTPQDVAGAFDYLLGAGADCVNGVNLPVTCGIA